MATNHLASWAFHLQCSDLPDDVVRVAVKTFYNWAGCAVGGSNHPAATIAVCLHFLVDMNIIFVNNNNVLIKEYIALNIIPVLRTAFRLTFGNISLCRRPTCRAPKWNRVSRT